VLKKYGFVHFFIKTVLPDNGSPGNVRGDGKRNDTERSINPIESD